MDRINGADTIDIGAGRRGFRSENLVAGVSGTEVTDLFLNSVQEEILKVITEAGLVPSASDWSQLWQALKIIGLTGLSRGRRWMAVVSMTLSSAPGAPTQRDAYYVPAGATGIWAGNSGKIAEWTGSAWSYFVPSDGHGIALPDGRVFERVEGAYIEKIALDVQSGKWSYAAAGGTANALTVTLSPAPLGYAAITGATVRILIGPKNTGPATLNVNGLGALPIVDLKNNALADGDLPAGQILELICAGSAWVLTSLAVSQQQKIGRGTLLLITASQTWIVPPNVTRINRRVWGSGGGGGGVTVTLIHLEDRAAAAAGMPKAQWMSRLGKLFLS